MELKQAKHVFKEMNRMGGDGTPFLFVIDFAKEFGLISALESLDNQIVYQIGESLHTDASAINLEKSPIALSAYKKRFEIVQNAFEKGEVSYLNLTAETPIQTHTGLQEIYTAAQAPYKLLWKDHFVCFSPEPFVRFKAGEVYSYPMKGTLLLTESNCVEDLLSNPKEQREHAQAVVLMKADLEQIAEHVQVTRYRFIDKINTVAGLLAQTSSELKGELPKDYVAHLGDIFNQLLPAASICGAPKRESFDLIKSVEPEKRGFYTGVFGVFDGANLESSVLIRFIEQKEKGLVYKSGGGITKDSDPEKEYDELLNKIYVPTA